MAASMDDVVKTTLKKVSQCTTKPEEFLSAQPGLASDLRLCTKSLYDAYQQALPGTSEQCLPELIIASFDDEQVWQELELHNGPGLGGLIANVAQLTVGKPCGFDFVTETTAADEALSNDADDDDEGVEDGDGGESLDEEGDASEEEASDLENDPLIPNVAFGEESDEEKELEALLDKAMNEDKEEGMEDEDDDDSDINFDFETKEKPKPKTHLEGTSKPDSLKNKRRTVVDDTFFKMADMEQFLDAEDEKEERRRNKEDAGVEGSDSEDDEAESDSETEQFMYGDFFDPPEANKKKKVRFVGDSKEDGAEENEEEEEMEEESLEGQDTSSKKLDLLGSSDSEGEDAEDILGRKKQPKSSFELRQERLKARISDMESASLASKPWQLMGEVAGGVRPENSLLEEDLDFDHTTRLAPQITEETTKSLEDIIKQRIKDKSWDDVERQVKPTEQPFEYKKRIVLDQEKSKQSLSQIYEQEYLKLQQKEEEEKKDPDHEAIKKMMTSLFVKLDALSNFHYTPKPAAPEVQIVSNQPSITMEEVAPVNVSDAARLAPEEIEEKQKGELTGKTERSESDKKRALREKKSRQRKRHQEKERKEKAIEKARPGLGNKYAKEKAMKDLEKQSKAPRGNVRIIEGKGTPSLTSSSKFFTQLQEEVTAHVQSRKAAKKKKIKDKQGSASKYKL